MDAAKGRATGSGRITVIVDASRALSLAMLVVVLLLLTGCGNSSPYGADCRREVANGGFGEGSEYWQSAIEGCEATLRRTHVRPRIFAEEP